MEPRTDTDADFELKAPPRSSRRFKLWMAIVGGAVALLCCGGPTVMVAFITSSDNADESEMNFEGCGDKGGGDVKDGVTVRDLNKEQTANAATIIKVGQEMGIPPKGWIVAIATAMQESTLRNINYGDRDSLGLFQQRPSMGWGTPAQITDPEYSSKKFYEGLKKVKNWEGMPITVAAQTVQRSAFPDAYAKWEPIANDAVNTLTDGAARSSAKSGKSGECADPGEVTAGGWTAPLKAPVTSGFRGPGRPTHNGVDLGTPKGTPVKSASSGVVLVVKCQATMGGSPYSCDQDGSPSVSGCGWYLDIQHAGGIITRYCHLKEKPKVSQGEKVKTGQVIGMSGNSGSSSGPHLHFEVHTNGDRSSAGATEPLAWMKNKGVKIGT